MLDALGEEDLVVMTYLDFQKALGEVPPTPQICEETCLLSGFVGVSPGKTPRAPVPPLTPFLRTRSRVAGASARHAAALRNPGKEFLGQMSQELPFYNWHRILTIILFTNCILIL